MPELPSDPGLEFPDGPPPPYLERRLSDLGGWLLDLGCECWDREVPISSLSERLPGDPTVRDVLARMRCPRCKQPPSSAYLVDEPLSRVEREGARRQSINLMAPQRG